MNTDAGIDGWLETDQGDCRAIVADRLEEYGSRWSVHGATGFFD